MGMIDRYKKKGGFIQLLNLIETSSKTKQEQFLNLIAQESPAWETEIRKKQLNIEKIFSWDKEYLVEVITRIQPLTIAVSLRHFDDIKKEKILTVLSQGEKRKIQSLIEETNPSPAEILTCLNKIIIEVRGLIQQGIIKLEKVDPELVIPENIEDLISQKSQPNYIQFESNQNSDKNSSNDEEVKLDFSGANRTEKYDSSKEEIDFLKKKVNSLVQENSQLKTENSILKNKLEQIRKIA